jgi:TolB-like protein
MIRRMVDTPTPVAIRGHLVDLRGRRLLRADGSEVDLRPQALDLLCELARHTGEVVSKRELFDRVWPGLVVTDDSLVQAVSDVRRAIGDEHHAALQTVPRRGYRLIAQEPPMPATAGAAAPAGFGAAAPGRPPAPPARRARVAWVAVALLALGLSLALAAWRPWHGGPLAAAAPAPDRPPIAVLDFADPAAPAEDQLVARAYAEELIGELARNADLRIIAGTSSFAVDRDAGPEAVGRRLRAGYLVSGSVRREGDHLRVQVRLVDAADGHVVWSERHDVGAAQIPAVRDALVRKVAGTLHSTLRGSEEARGLQRAPASMDVYAMTLRAIALKHRFNAADNAEARRLLEQVVVLDPQYAPGWIYLGMVNAIAWANRFDGPAQPEAIRAAVEQLERGVALDPALSAGHLGLSFVYPYVGRLEDGVRAGRRCVALAPSDGECMIFLAAQLAFAGDAAEAVELSDRAMAMNPLPPTHVHLYRAHTLWAAGRLDEALAAYDACLQQAPKYVLCRTWRMLTLAEAGRIDTARADYEVVRRDFKGDSIERWIAARYGPRAQALAARRVAALRVVAGADPVAAR